MEAPQLVVAKLSATRSELITVRCDDLVRHLAEIASDDSGLLSGRFCDVGMGCAVSSIHSIVEATVIDTRFVAPPVVGFRRRREVADCEHNPRFDAKSTYAQR
jgi:hypothetical protein